MATREKWKKLVSVIDGRCDTTGTKKKGYGKGHGRFNKPPVKVGKYSVSDSQYKKLRKNLGREITPDDLNIIQKAIADEIESWECGEVKLLSNTNNIGIRSKKYDRSLVIARKDYGYLIYNWSVKNFSVPVENEWRALSVDGTVHKNLTGPSGECFAHVNIEDLDDVKKLLT